MRDIRQSSKRHEDFPSPRAALLPDYLIEENSGLVQLFGEADTLQLDAYFVYPEELRTVATYGSIPRFSSFRGSGSINWRSECQQCCKYWPARRAGLACQAGSRYGSQAFDGDPDGRIRILPPQFAAIKTHGI